MGRLSIGCCETSRWVGMGVSRPTPLPCGSDSPCARGLSLTPTISCESIRQQSWRSAECVGGGAEDGFLARGLDQDGYVGGISGQ